MPESSSSKGKAPVSTGDSNTPVIPAKRGRKAPKNAAGQRQNAGWEHGVSVDGDSRRVKCKYCEETFNGGIYRFKHHLAGTKSNVGHCPKVPDDVRQKMWDICFGLQSRLVERKLSTSAETDIVNSAATSSIGGGGGGDGKQKKIQLDPAHMFKRGATSQPTLNNIFKKKLKEDADLQVASFFYNNAIAFNVIKDEEFIKMCQLVSEFGRGYKPPSYHDIRTNLLKKKVEETDKILLEHKAVWKKTGCTIMTDGWTDQRRRSLLNFLVNSPKGSFYLRSYDASSIPKTADVIFKMMDDIVEEVGEENVVQITTDNAAN